MMASITPGSGTRTIRFDARLLRTLGVPVPRYASYPTAGHFSDSFGYRDYLQAVASLRTRGSARPLSLYIHIPFCESGCHFCSCDKIVSKSRDKAATYLSYLKREIEMQGQLFAGMNQVTKLQLGGGSPTYLSDEQMSELMRHIRQCFQLAPDEQGEYAIEVDPRTVTPERVQALRRQGFNRISIGVQDFDARVLGAVNRCQGEAATLAVIAAARAAQFRTVTVDLVYGLPLQNVISVGQTLAKVIAAGPDRIALYDYHHSPALHKGQRLIDPADLPGEEAKLDMLALCIKRLGDAGYVYIGIDHFARPDDELAVAQRQGRLHRSFAGYSKDVGADLVACGVSAIGNVAMTYSQNAKSLELYYDRLDKNELPITRGIKLSMDDALRRSIIQMLMCSFELSIPAIEVAYPITFHSYFAAELGRLVELETQGVLVLDGDWISITARGRLLVRRVCAVFDRYLAPKAAPRALR